MVYKMDVLALKVAMIAKYCEDNNIEFIFVAVHRNKKLHFTNTIITNVILGEVNNLLDRITNM